MIDQNGLIEIINSVAPVIATSPVLIKLFDTATDIFKTLYTPTLTLKNGKAEVDVEIYKKQKNMELFENQTFTMYEIAKLKNFVHTVNFAAEELNEENEQTCSDEPVDFDWLMRFFDAVSNISNEELQKLWGQVLAGEIKQPGVCSLRTLDIIRNLSQKEAKIFNNLCRYVVSSGDCTFIFSNGFHELDGTNEKSYAIIENTGMKYSTHIVPMIESGLLSIDNALTTDFKTNNILHMHDTSIICLIFADENKNNFLSIEPYFLTTSGIELFKIISSSPNFTENTEYKLCCYQELKETYTDLKISAYRITGTNSFENKDLLY